MADVFISYSRRDATFVHELHDVPDRGGQGRLGRLGGHPARLRVGARHRGEHRRGRELRLRRSATNSLASKYCTIELARAQKGGKRVVPIAMRSRRPGRRTAGATRAELDLVPRRRRPRRGAREALPRARHRPRVGAGAHAAARPRGRVGRAQGRQPAAARARPRAGRAQELAANAGNEPAPTELQQRYVLESRRAASRRQRVTLGGVTLALVVSLALGVVALLQRNTANDRARVAESQALAARSVSALATAPAAALADGVEAIETSATPEASVALRRAILANPVEYVIPAAKADRRAAAAAFPTDSHNGVARETLAFSADGSLLLGLTPRGVAPPLAGRGRTARPGSPDTSHAEAAALGPGAAARGGRRRRAVGRAPAAAPRGCGASAPAPAWSASASPALRRSPCSPAAATVERAERRDRSRPSRLGVSRLRLERGAERRRHASRHARRRRAGAPCVSGTRGPDACSRRCRAGYPSAAAVSPDGRFVATIGSAGGTLWSVDRQRSAREARPGGTRPLQPRRRALPSRWARTATPASGGRASGRLVATLPGFGSLHDRQASYSTTFAPGAAFGPDGRLLAVAAADGIVRVWELATRKQVAAVAMGWANVLAFAPRGGRLAGDDLGRRRGRRARPGEHRRS